MTEIVEFIPPDITAFIAPELDERATELAANARAKNTRTMYASYWRAFSGWCEQHQVDPLCADPRVVARYVVQRSEDLSASSIRVMLAAIKEAYRLKRVPMDWEDEYLRRILLGTFRDLGSAAKKATAVTPNELRRLVDACQSPDTHIGARDRAMLIMAYGAAGRQSEVVGLLIGDVVPEPGKGLHVHISRSKTDQAGEGKTLGVGRNPVDPELCPVTAYERWMGHRGLAYSGPDAPLFTQIDKSGRVTAQGLSSKGFYRAVKAAAARAGLADAGISGHSMRRGWATQAARRGASLDRMMSHMRHKTPRVSAGYIEEARRFEDAVDVW